MNELPSRPPELAANGVLARFDALEQMLAAGQLTQVSAATLDRFLAGSGLRLLMFSGLPKRSSEAQDVAVALRELIAEHQLPAALIDPADEADLKERFRVVVVPSLVLVVDGAPLEVVPGVRDWVDYQRALGTYLGQPIALEGLH